MGKAIVCCGFNGDGTKVLAPGVSNVPILQMGQTAFGLTNRIRMLGFNVALYKIGGGVAVSDPPVKLRMVFITDSNSSYRTDQFISWRDDSISEPLGTMAGVCPAASTWDTAPSAVLRSWYMQPAATPNFEVEFPRNTGPIVLHDGITTNEVIGIDATTDAAATDTLRVRVGYTAELF